MSNPNLGHGYGIATIAVALPADIVSLPPLFFRSTPTYTNPLRTLDILGMPDFFDHSGNCTNGATAAMVIMGIGLFVNSRVNPEKRKAVTVGTSVAAALGAVGTNVAYEAGVYIPPYPQKPHDAPFDTQDALYGGITGTLFSVVACISALRYKAKKRQNKS